MLHTNTVIWNRDGAAGSPESGVNKQTEGHHTQGQDRGTGCHADTEEQTTWTVLDKKTPLHTLHLS